MSEWFGALRTRHNPPEEALNMEVTAWGPIKKGDALQIVIPVEREMVLTKGTKITVTVNFK